MEHIREFSKNVHTYDAYTGIQKKVAKHLIRGMQFHPKKILDLGSGTGEVYRQIDWKMESFVAVDFSKKMCETHPRDSNITVINDDFESTTCKQLLLEKAPFDCVVSASALQWSKDIKTLLSAMRKMSPYCALAIFTDRTFFDIYSVSKLETFLPSYKALLKDIQMFYNCRYELKTYRLEFQNSLEMFRYIKKSGVSGGKRRLDVSQTKSLIAAYPHNYLEFEVLYIWSKDNK